jgi:hypothetical protein
MSRLSDRPWAHTNAFVRGTMALLSALNLLWGVAAIAKPRLFFDEFPGFGFHWTAAYPPYNEHLVTDLGAIFVTLGVLLGAAAWLGERRVTAVVLIGVLTFNTVHLVFHAIHHGTLTGVDLVASLTALTLGVLLPGALLLLCRRLPA